MTEPSSAGLIDGVSVDALAAAIRSCAAVDDLYSTPATAVASYLPGRQIPGVRVTDDAVLIQVRSRWGIPISDLARQVRLAVTGLVGPRRIDITVADITDAPSAPVPALPPADTSIETDKWTNTSSGAESVANSSEPITPIGAAIRPHSLPG